MSGAYPSTPAFESLKISSVQPTLTSVSHSLVRQARSRGGAQRWLFEGQYNANLTRAEIAPIIAFALAQRGQYEIFTFTPPALWSTARGVATGAPRVQGAGQTGRTVHVDGWTANTAGILRAGDFLKFSGHSKVYMVTADAASDAGGLAHLVIEPALMASPADNETVAVANVPFSVAFASDIQAFDISSEDFHSFKISLVEVL